MVSKQNTKITGNWLREKMCFLSMDTPEADRAYNVEDGYSLSPDKCKFGPDKPTEKLG